jgi:hypothetical protein
VSEAKVTEINQEESGGQAEWSIDSWESASAPQTKPSAPPIILPKNAKGAVWIETKYNKEKTLGYRVMRWRDGEKTTAKGSPKKMMLYVRRLGGIYVRKQPKERVNRDHLVGEYVVRKPNNKTNRNRSTSADTNPESDGIVRGANTETATKDGGQSQTDPIESK